ncbi:Helicase-like transcription factor [Merluccius polli]|uniref:Helicase-like transcription factor n=1 Tax=Merluccius polli TaxID=89951 RepID=A0AA47MKA7_MERPO|nr:Helicase-like transcription factor [Merluccius polli]
MSWIRRRSGWTSPAEVDLFIARFESSAESLSQALRVAASSAAAAAETDADTVPFGQLQGTVVGLRYYTGVVNPGEMVALVREPQNPYDRNAVMVANMDGSQVGHIKKDLAAAMAFVMDNNLAKVEGVVPYRNNAFTMPVSLSFWGAEEDKPAFTQRMAQHGFKMNSGGIMSTSNGAQGGRPPAKKPVTIPLSAEELKNAFDNLFDGLMESKEGEKEAAELVSTPLLPHQKQALSWMCACENGSTLPPFWEQRGALYYNTLTCFSAKDRPQRVRGGILADDMGLTLSSKGKTLTTIALILTNFHQGKPLPVQRCEELTEMAPSRPEGSEDSTVVRDAAIGSPRSDSPQTSAETQEVMIVSSDAQKKKTTVLLEDLGFAAALSGSTSSTKPKNKRSAKKAVPKDDLDFAAALSGSTSVTKSKNKRSAKKAVPEDRVLPCISENAEELSARATLIICPLSVLSNWLDQFEQHVRADVQPNVYLYYGPERNRSTSFLASQDVVLTTYNVLAADHANKSPLHAVSWLRVVLDEGHVIRNPNTQMAKAVLHLKAQRRWILSGTPIQNSVKDMWMLLAFLQLKPFDIKEWWNRVIQRPVTQGDRAGLLNLQTLVRCITLRRTKSSTVNGRPLVALPKKTVCVEQVELTPQERAEYELARLEGQSTVSRYVAEGSVMSNYADVLAILMRLRQHCCHPDLLAKIASDLSVATTPAELRQRLVEKLRAVLASGSDEECSVCLESVRLPVITHCAHVYCRPCIAQVVASEREMARCPLCRSDLTISQLVEVPPEELEGEEDGARCERWRTSSKVEALLGNLLRLRSEDRSIKCLVVSQFTRFLSILETPLREQGFSFVRLDGTLSPEEAGSAGGVGLNLTAASHVFLMEPAWNPAAEEQCIDRCHRLGQTRKVFVTKFIVKDSVEENMVKIQRRKQDLVEKAFGSKNTDRKTSRIDDIRALMEL